MTPASDSSKYKIVPEGDGFYTIKDVPIFETHDSRGFNCDQKWMQGTIQNFEAQKAAGYRPPIIIGHNVKGGPEKEAEGFIDNLRLIGNRLYADLTRIPRHLKDKFKQNRYPSRSVEVLPKSKRIIALALLGGTTPYFALPQIVYSEKERSIWYRSPDMKTSIFDSQGHNSSFDDVIRNVAQEAAEATIAQYAMNGDEGDDSPDVYSLSIPQAAEYLRDNPDAEIFQGEDGNLYTAVDENTFYEIPEQLLYAKTRKSRKMVKKPGRLSIMKDRVFDTARRHGSRIREGAGNEFEGIKTAIRHPFATTKRGAVGIGSGAQRLGSGIKHVAVHPIESAKSVGNASLEGLRNVGGAFRHPVRTALAGGRVLGRAGRFIENHPISSAATAGAVLTAAELERRHRRRHDRRGYNLDETTGILYFDGMPVGEITAYDVSDLPQPENAGGDEDPDLVIEESAVGPNSGRNTSNTMDPGDPDNEFVEPLDRAESDQFALDDDATSYVGEDDEAQVQLYNLQQQVNRLQYANDLLTVSKKAEQYKRYLLELKRSGAPVGDIDGTVDFMLSQNDEQVHKFMDILAKSPKVALGPTQFSMNPVDQQKLEAQADYQANRQTYEAMGISEKELQYADYVRTNTFGGSNNQKNGQSIFD